MGRGSPNFEEKHSFLEKTFRINSKHWNLRTIMHEYEMIWFSKTRILSPNSPKQKFLHSPQIFKQQINFAQNSKYLQNLVGQTINTHNNMYKV